MELVGSTNSLLPSPWQDGDNYINRKQYASLTGQFTADADYHCLDLIFGYHGSVHDSRMFRLSSLKRRILSGTIPLLAMEPIPVCHVGSYWAGENTLPLHTLIW